VAEIRSTNRERKALPYVRTKTTEWAGEQVAFSFMVIYQRERKENKHLFLTWATNKPQAKGQTAQKGVNSKDAPT
jgi:hypothetical protein